MAWLLAAISAGDSLFVLMGWRAAVQGAVRGSRPRCRGDHKDELLGRWNDKSEGIDKAVLRSSSTSGEVETSGSIDPQAILERLEEHRLADVSEAADDGEPEAMLFSLQDMKEELDAFRWITAEVVARRIELEALEQENQAFREEQASLRQRYEDMMEEAELDVREDGAAS